MSDASTFAGALLVFGPLVGAIPVAYPPLLTIWTASREDHIRTVAAHWTAWRMLNGGFAFATVATTAGLGVLSVSTLSDPTQGWLMVAATVAYGMAGVLWMGVLATRSITTPTLFDLGAADEPAGPAERLIGAAIGGLFAAFVLATSLTLIALGAGLALSGAIAAPVAWLAALISGLVLAGEATRGDTIPAVLYVPTMLIGIALLASWR